jgi:adenylylsulfate kinase-like enzyme
MGRRAIAEELLAQAEANGYKRGVHKGDQVRHRKKHVKMTTRDQDATLRRYVLYVETLVLAIT